MACKHQFQFHYFVAWYFLKVPQGKYCWLDVVRRKNTGTASKAMWVYERRSDRYQSTLGSAPAQRNQYSV